MKKSFLSMVRDHLGAVPPLVSADLRGKTVVVVGANQGLGFEATKHYARMNPGKLVLACRDERKAKAALAVLEQETGCKTGEVWLLDLAKFASVSAFADRFEREGGRLDVLLANAAMLTPECRMTDDGWEEMMQVNYLSTALLCLLLLPRAKATAERFGTSPRIIVVNSELHYFADFTDEVYTARSAVQLLNRKKHLTPDRIRSRYFETKLLDILFVQSLADLLKDTDIIPISTTPGLCVSNLRRELPAVRRVMVGLMVKLIGRTTEEGGRLLVNCARLDLKGGKELDGLRGAYVNGRQVDEPHDDAVGERGKRFREKFWTELVDELAKVDGRVRDIVASYKH